MHKLVYADSGVPVEEGAHITLPGKDVVTVNRIPKVAGFKAIHVLRTFASGNGYTSTIMDADELGLEWREFPDVPPAVVMEGGPRNGYVLHGPFPSEDDAIKWASRKFPHTAWFVAPLHKPE